MADRKNSARRDDLDVVGAYRGGEAPFPVPPPPTGPSGSSIGQAYARKKKRKAS